MQIRKTLYWVMVLLVLIPAGAATFARAETEATETDAAKQERLQKRLALVQSMTNMTLSVLQDQKKNFAERQEVMQRGITNMVDTDWIAKFVLGNAWRTATDEQKERYTKLYRAYLTKMYIANFAQSSERKIQDMKILGVDNSEDDRFNVKTEVMLSNANNLKVNYLVRQQDNHNKIIDVTIEGVSLITSHRAEFSPLASSKGVDTVIAKLEKLVAEEKPPMQLSAN